MSSRAQSKSVEASESKDEALLAEQLQSMRALGAGVAHDAINTLGAMDFDLKVLDSVLISPEAVESLQSLHSLTDHLLGLSCGLRMAITDSTSKARRETRIAEWWPHCSPLLHAVIRSGVTIHADIAADLPPIRMTPHDLTRLVLNLATNAADAIRERRRTGDSERRLIGELRIAATADCGGEAVKLTVSDNGIGMSPEILARVREPYFTTKAGRGGTGLGLMITEHLVSEAGGFLDIQSQPMEGTVVTIVLPAVSSSRPGDATTGRAADIKRSHGS